MDSQSDIDEFSDETDSIIKTTGVPEIEAHGQLTKDPSAHSSNATSPPHNTSAYIVTASTKLRTYQKLRLAKLIDQDFHLAEREMIKKSPRQVIIDSEEDSDTSQLLQ